MKPKGSSETSEHIFRITRCNIAGDSSYMSLSGAVGIADRLRAGGLGFESLQR